MFYIFILVRAYADFTSYMYPLISYYNRNGARCSIGVGFVLRVLGVVPDTDVSEAPEGFLDNFEDGGSGVLDPLDGVRTLKQTTVYT